MSHVLVIGGTKGLGRVVARQFAERGDVVSVIGRNEMPAADLSAGNIHSYSVDIADTNSLFPMLDKIIEERGRVNYCVFLQRYRGKEDDWHGEFQISLTATKNIVEYLIPCFSHEGDKAILMVGSVFSHYVGKGQPASYHVIKAALHQLMRYYAVNLGDVGIRCNGITPFTFLKEESKSFYLNNKPLLEVYENIIPLKRMPTTEDSANAITFLCSPQAAFITGQDITIDGGLSLVWPETLARSMAKV